MIAEVYEQLIPYKIQDDRLLVIKLWFEAPWLTVYLV